MSHFSRVRTKFVDEECLRRALTRSGYPAPPGTATIGGWNGQSQTVEVGIPDVVDGYGIGFDRGVGPAFGAVADWSELRRRGVQQDLFVNKVSQAYGIEATLASMQPQGFAIVEQKNEADGSVRIVMRRVS